jgi:hypothetical protein
MVQINPRPRFTLRALVKQGRDFDARAAWIEMKSLLAAYSLRTWKSARMMWPCGRLKPACRGAVEGGDLSLYRTPRAPAPEWVRRRTRVDASVTYCRVEKT